MLWAASHPKSDEEAFEQSESKVEASVRLKRLHPLDIAGLRRLLSNIPAGLRAVGLASLAATVLVSGIKQWGGLESLELRAYDWMVSLRPDAATDDRLLIVGITEADIRALQRSTPTDETIAAALANLQQAQPLAIGLDLYRDVPQGTGQAALSQQLQADNLIAITKLGDQASHSDDAEGVPAPPGVSPERVGFNDFTVDPDGVVRRNLLFAGSSYSFSLRLALRYLNSQNIAPIPSPRNPEVMQLGQAAFQPLSASSGGYQNNDDRGYQILLNYRSRQNIARQVSLSQVLQHQVNASWVRGKIVLLGTVAPSGKDLFYTPYSAGAQTDHRMPGVEVHAQMVSQLISAALNQRPLFWFLPDRAEIVWIAVWAIVGGTIAWCVRQPLALVMSGTGLLLSLSATGIVILALSGWVPVVAPALATAISMGTVVTYCAQQARQQQQMVMKLLGQNTSKEIADALWSNRDRLLQSGKLPGQRLVATMLFTDIKDFSTLSEQISPEALLDWLNEYLSAMTQAIQQHGGIINKFTGDGLLAVFGVPVPHNEPREIASDAQQAVACALAMGSRLQQLNPLWQQRNLPAVQMRVGIYTGTVVVGSLGSKDRLEYGVIGDSVNIASRLESCAKERQDSLCRILIAQETLTHLQDQFQVESWGPMALKGKQQQVEVYRVVGSASTAAPPSSKSMDSEPLLPLPETNPDPVNS